MINNQLLEEVIYVSNKDKFINKKQIKKIITNIVDNTDDLTKNRFNEVYFETVNWSGDVVCSCTSMGEIKVNYEKLINELKSIKKKSCLEANLEIVVTLLHEIEHLKESSKIMKNDFESFLLSYSSLEIFKSLAEERLETFQGVLSEKMYSKIVERQQEKLYMKSYNLNPSERLATINSYKLLFESLKNYEGFKEKYNYYFRYLYKEYIRQYYIGYKLNRCNNKLNIPIIDYFKFIEMPDLLNQFDFYSPNELIFLKLSSQEFNIRERMLYGLPVTLQETKKLDKKLILTK